MAHKKTEEGWRANVSKEPLPSTISPSEGGESKRLKVLLSVKTEGSPRKKAVRRKVGNRTFGTCHSPENSTYRIRSLKVKRTLPRGTSRGGGKSRSIIIKKKTQFTRARILHEKTKGKERGQRACGERGRSWGLSQRKVVEKKKKGLAGKKKERKRKG